MELYTFLSRFKAVALNKQWRERTRSWFVVPITAASLLVGTAAWAGPVIEVTDGTNAITNGSKKSVEFDGLVSVYTAPVAPATVGTYTPATLTKTFKIKNTGDSPLLINDITVISSYPVGTFSAGTFPPSIAPGTEADITVIFDAAQSGVIPGDGVSPNLPQVNLVTGKLQIFNNQIDRTPYVFPVSAFVSDTAPHIQVFFDETSQITDLGAVAISTDAVAVNFNTTINQPITKTFTVRNIGGTGADPTTPTYLEVGTISLTDISTGTLGVTDFTVGAVTPATATTPGLLSGESATFDITLSGVTPTTTGAPFDADVNIVATNAGVVATTSPFAYTAEFNFRINGTVAPQPEIQVSDTAGTILHDPDGVNLPNDFGSVTVGGTPFIKTFTVENLGTADLILTNPITLDTNGGFSLVSSQFTTTTIAPGGSTTFDVQLDTTTIGTYSGTISFGNNDADGGDGIESPFTFAIKGVVSSGPNPEIEVWQLQSDGSKTAIADGQSDFVSFDALIGTTPLPTQTFEIRNTGGAPLELTALNPLPAGFSLVGFFPESIQPGESGSFTIQLNDTSAEATYQGEVQIFSDDGLNDGIIENPFNFPIRGIVRAPAPEIEVLEGTTDITDGTTAIDFGTTNAGTPVNKLFTINNIGEEELTLTTPTLPTGFTISGIFPSVIPAQGSATFTLQLTAAEAGNFTGEISFANNDNDENPFNFPISGVVDATIPAVQEIEVWFGEPAEIPHAATPITDGTTTTPGTAIDFGNTPVGTDLVETFTVRNLGLTDLLLFGNNAPSGFEVLGTLTPVVPAQGEITFQVRLDGTTAGAYSGTFQLFNNDINETPFDFPISGTVGSVSQTEPEIQVLDGTTEVIDGTATVDFGTTSVSTNITKTFTVKNVGGADLNLINDVTVTGTGFTVNSFTSPQTLASGESTTFQVVLNATAAGSYDGTISIDNDDSDEHPFDFAVTGIVNGTSTADTPEIQVLENNIDIVDGGTVDFGTTQVGTFVDKIFAIRNSGNADLTLTSDVTFAGTGFTVTSFTSPVTIAPSEEISFQVTLDAAAAGNFNGTLSFANDDSDENPFNFSVSGVVTEEGTPPPTTSSIQVLDGTTEITDGATTPIDFGTTQVGEPLAKTFTVKNTTPNILDLYGYPVIPQGFSIGVYPENIAANDQFTFEIQLNTSVEGTFSGAVKLFNSAEPQNPFDFVISGTVTKEGGSTVNTPEIQVLDGATDVLDGANTSIDFGGTGVGTPVTRTFTVKNTGQADLTLTSAAVFSGGSGFTVNSFPVPKTLAPEEMTTFEVVLTAAAEGEFFGTVSFDNNDSDENPFNFPVSGRATQGGAVEKVCFEQGGLLSGGICAPTPGLTAGTTGAPTNTEIKGGISKYENNQFDPFKITDTVLTTTSVITAGVLKVDSADVGKSADIIVAGHYAAGIFPKGFEWYTLVNCSTCPLGWRVDTLPYDETTAIPVLTKPGLLPLKTVNSLPTYYTIDLYEGLLPIVGNLSIYFGYRIDEGDGNVKVVYTQTPIQVTVNQ